MGTPAHLPRCPAGVLPEMCNRVCHLSWRATTAKVSVMVRRRFVAAAMTHQKMRSSSLEVQAGRARRRAEDAGKCGEVDANMEELGNAR